MQLCACVCKFVSCARHHLSSLLCHDFLHPALPDGVELWIIALQDSQRFRFKPTRIQNTAKTFTYHGFNCRSEQSASALQRLGRSRFRKKGEYASNHLRASVTPSPSDLDSVRDRLEWYQSKLNNGRCALLLLCGLRTAATSMIVGHRCHYSNLHRMGLQLPTQS